MNRSIVFGAIGAVVGLAAGTAATARSTPQKIARPDTAAVASDSPHVTLKALPDSATAIPGDTAQAVPSAPATDSSHVAASAATSAAQPTPDSSGIVRATLLAGSPDDRAPARSPNPCWASILPIELQHLFIWG